MRTNLHSHSWPLLALGGLLMAFLGDAVSQGAEPPDLADFGYNTMRMEGAPASGTRPLLIVLVDFDTAPAFGHTSSYYDSLFFSPTNSKGIQGLFRDNSRGRFNWVRAGAGVVGPVHLAATDRAYSTSTNFAGEAYDTNMVIKVMRSGVFDFRSYDTNGDKRVTANELTIVFISNDEWIDPSHPTLPFAYLGANRDWQIYDPVSDYSICWQVFTSHKTGLESTAHELCHALGTRDCYSKLAFDGQKSAGLTLMSYTSDSADDTSSIHLDPWHKLQLGWSEPRIHSMEEGGKIQLPAAQIFARPDAPLLLHEPSLGTNEYFLLEYRNPYLPDSRYDEDLAYNNTFTNYGLVIWHVGTSPYSWLPVAAEGPTNLTRGSPFVWPAGAVTPRLRALNDSWLPAAIHVGQFGTSDATITVDWAIAGDVWVDFASTQLVALGTFDLPFKTLSAGLMDVTHGGTLKFKPGISAETPTITKRVRLEAVGGHVTIGR